MNPSGENGAPLVRAWIGLGSNLDDPLAQLRRAVAALAALPDCRLAAVSSAWRNPALVLPGSDEQQPDYLNAVAALDTALPPLALLDALQSIERAQGRTREKRWGPRTLDLDLLLYGDAAFTHPRLTLPHPGMRERLFVLRPLHDLAQGLRLPDGSAVADLLAACPPSPLARAGELT